jgi:hypothetical protein
MFTRGETAPTLAQKINGFLRAHPAAMVGRFFCLDYHPTWTHVKRLLINISMQVDDSPNN